MKYENYARTVSESFSLCHSAEEENVAAGATYGPVVRNALIIECCTFGKGSVTINGREFLFGEGEGFVLFPGDTIVHKTYAPGRSDCWCTLIAPRFITPLHEAGLDALHPFLKKEIVGEATACIERMISIREVGMGGDMRRQAAVYELLGLILRDLPSQKENTAVGKALALMEERYRAPLSVAELADAVGLERTYFSSLFKKTTGVSPYVYLGDLRIRRACELLRRSEKSISEIAEEVGLDYRNFARVFKQKTGQSPKGYRLYSRTRQDFLIGGKENVT